MIRSSMVAMVPLILAIANVAALAQSSTSTAAGWEPLNPEGEEFTVSMPKNSTREQGTETYIKRELNTRTYLWTEATGPVLAVFSLSGIKSNPAAYSEIARFNSYVDAFKKLFPQKVRGKEAVAKLTLVGEKQLHGHAGREYRLNIADLSGTAQVYLTKRRFYAVVALNKKPDQVLQDRFLASFVLPEKPPEPPPPAPEPAPAGTAAKTEGNTEAKPGAAETAAAQPTPAPGTENKPSDAIAAVQPGSKPPLSGGVLNGKALSLPQPEYPAEARAAKAAGVVTVQVTIDEYGNVASASATAGHPLLRQVSVDAAMQAKFSPTFLMGEPVKVTGVLTFNFTQ